MLKYALFILLIMNFSVWFLVADYLTVSGSEIIFLNVGQGDAALLRLGRVNILIDAGPSKSVIYQVDKIFPFYKPRFDLLISTHPHLDHAGGFFEVILRYKIGKFIYNGMVHNDRNFALAFKNLLESGGINAISLKAKDRILYGNKKLVFLWPQKPGFSRNDLNDNSLIFQFYQNGKPVAVFMADASSLVENELIKIYGNNLKTPIIKIGHHGSKKSTSDDFLEAVDPKIAVISVGKNNYGHPGAEVVGRIKRKEIELLRTDIDGSVRIKI